MVAQAAFQKQLWLKGFERKHTTEGHHKLMCTSLSPVRCWTVVQVL